jgi:hypothetical protein
MINRCDKASTYDALEFLRGDVDAANRVWDSPTPASALLQQRSDRDDDLPELAVGLEVAMNFNNLVKGEGLVDDRL